MAIFCLLLFIPVFSGASQITSAVTDTVSNKAVGADLSGFAWLDVNSDNDFDAGETPLTGWTVQVTDNNNTLLAATDVAVDGSYRVRNLPPGTNHIIQLIHVESNVVVSEIRNMALNTDINPVDQNLAVDPSGVVYDSKTRLPLPGSILQLTDRQGRTLPDACLLSGQQNQVTGTDGRYFFAIQTGADPACPVNETTYQLSISNHPAGYRDSVMIPAQAGSLDVTPAGIPCPADVIQGDPCHVQAQAVAPGEGEATTYYRDFIIAQGDQGIVNNHIPLDLTVAETSIWLNKSVARAEAMLGDIVQYSLRAENTEDFGLQRLNINDDLPPGFQYVTDSAQIIRAGADGLIDTADDQHSTIVPIGTDPISFSGLDFAADETVIIRYFLRVSAGVAPGVYINTAQVIAPGNHLASNIATASVDIVQDPLLEKTAVIGKVFHDRDGDGYQDNADASDIRIRSEHFGRERGQMLGYLAGRSRITSPVEEHQLQIRMPYSRFSSNGFEITTAEGTVIKVADDGEITTAHQGRKHQGLTAQNLQVRVERDTGALTTSGEQNVTLYAAGTEELVITVSNTGIHEEGIPGVRLATAEGLLIETDQYGRYHIADVDTGRFDRGRNYIVKVDPATLPEGTIFTTENPRVLRLTQALMTKFNFGVRLPQQNIPTTMMVGEIRQQTVIETIDSPVTKTLRDVIEPVQFASGESQIPEDYLSRLQAIIDELGVKENLRLRFIGHTDDQQLSVATAKRYGDNQGLSVARAEQLAETLSQGLDLSAEQILIEGLGATNPAASNDTPEGMALNRRVEVEIIYDQVVQVRDENTPSFAPPTPERQLTLPHGGIIWATEDPARLEPRLSIKASGPLKLKARQPVKPLKFRLYSNYAAFIDHWELLIFADKDKDHLKPLSRLTGRQLRQDQPVIWNGYLRDGKRHPVAGEHLRYILRVYDRNGFYDETAPQLIRVVETSTLGDHYSPRSSLLSDEKAETAVIDGQNHLIRQTIPLQGSRVRIYGADIRRDYKLNINGEKIKIDGANKFVWEQQLPLGQHEFAIHVDAGGGASWDRHIQMDVDGRYFFMVGLANLTAGENNIKGNVDSLAGDEHFDNDVWVDGRLAFYLKGKIKGKYLLTAQLDTLEDEISNLGDNLKRKDPQAVFRRLDPEQFYPVYGDDSTTISDVDTQGAFYVRLDWDKSRALWGNYNTAFTGNEFAQYNRSLYGAQYIHKGLNVTRHGDNRTELYAFASEAQTAQAHNEFLATGGSLYYLRETDIVRGSEKIRVEVRARDSQRVVSTATLVEGRDYQIDYLQGRLILSQPLAQYAAQNMMSIISDQPLEGDDVVLLVDYEYVPAGFSGEELSAGLRGKGWLTDAIALGGTYVQEARDNAADYTLAGIDLTYRLGQSSWIKGEYAESEYSQNDGWISANGGLSFAEIRNPSNAQEQGNAYGITGQVNLAEMTDEALQGRITAWWKSRQAGFSSTRVNDGIETADSGVEVDWEATERFQILGRIGELEQDNKTSRSFNLQARVKTGDKLTLIAETRREEATAANETLGFTDKGSATLAAVGAEYRIKPQTTLYGSVQTVAENSGSYEDNDALTLGARTQLNDRFALKGEITAGDRGKALILGVAYNVNTRFTAEVETGFGDAATTQIGSSYTTVGGTELYGSYIVDNDRTDKSTRTLTLGQRKRMNDDTRIYTEEQFNENPAEAGMTHVFGIEHKLNREFKLNLGVAHSDLESTSGENIQRDTLTTGLSYNDNIRLKASTKLEYRKDDGAEEVTQWLTTNAVDWKQSPNLRWLIRLNLSLTENAVTDKADGRFIEASLGFAYRPAFEDRMNVLGKYSYLYDLPAQLSAGSLLGQNDFSADERAHVLSLETIYDLNQHWELGGKLAWRVGETRVSRDEGEWFESGARLAALRTRYHFIANWDALAEYHVLEAETEDNQRDGALLGVYRHFSKHFKAGIGYNFTEFTDDLTRINNYDARGWFVDFTGKF